MRNGEAEWPRRHALIPVRALDIQRATRLSTAGSAKVTVTFEFCRSL
jgi:hypothetical protein